MKTPFHFNLQLFAEGDAVTQGEDVNATPHVSNATEQLSGAQTGEESDGQGKGAFAVQVNDITNRRELVVPAGVADEGAQDVDGAEGEGVDTTNPAHYTADELIHAMTIGAVDETRIPENLRANYIAIRQQQQLAIMKELQEATQREEVERAVNPLTVQEESMQRAVAQRKLYEEIQKAAEDKAKDDMGIKSLEELEDLRYSDNEEDQKRARAYQVALQMNIQELTRRVDDYQRQAVEEEARAAKVMQTIVPEVDKLRKEEPNFGAIDVMMADYYKELPYEEAVNVHGAIERLRANRPQAGDVPILKTYYTKTREAYYAKRAGVPLTPQPTNQAQVPYVEKTGATASRAKEPIDWRSMRQMDARERSAFLREHLREMN